VGTKNGKTEQVSGENFYMKLLKAATSDGINRFSVGAVISKGKKVLLFRREKNDFLGGIYEIPGGGIEEGETLVDCIKREIKEETGLSVKNVIGYVGSFDYSSENGGKTRQFNFTVTVRSPLVIHLSTEHDDYKWVTQEDFHRINPTKEMVEILGNFWKGGNCTT
jgi:8-oxo-dGTP diphosphatase